MGYDAVERSRIYRRRQGLKPLTLEQAAARFRISTIFIVREPLPATIRRRARKLRRLGKLVLPLLMLVALSLPAVAASSLLWRHGGTVTGAGDQIAALLPPDRNFSKNWKMAGLLSLGGIPNRTIQCGSTLSATGTTADFTNIQNAINACTAGYFVQLAAGTFNINSGCLSINKPVSLRGAGAGSTMLVVTNGAVLGNVNPGAHAACVVSLGGSPGTLVTTAFTADGIVGSSTVTVASTTGISPGNLVFIDELGIGQAMSDCCFNSGTGTVWASSDYRVEWNQHNPGVSFFDSACNGFANNNNFSCGTNGDECAYSVRCGGVNEELHLVTSVSGNTITFDSPLTLSYRVANSAQLIAYSSTSIIQQAGLENLTVQGGDAGNVGFSLCMYCWAKGVESTVWLNAGAFYFYYGAFRDQIENFWAHNAAWPVNGGGGYAINLTYGASEDLITNGISMLANKVDVVRASGSGVVFSYNYMDDGYINNQTWVETGLNCSHLGGSHGCLFEGNYTWNSDSDFTHGNATHSAYFRNWMTGFRAPFTRLDGTFMDDSAGCCGPMRAISDHPYTYWDSFIGNIAGKSGLMSSWTYRCATGNANSGCGSTVFNLGWNDVSSSTDGADCSMALSYPTVPTGGGAFPGYQTNCSGATSTITGAGCSADYNSNPGLYSPCVPILDGNYDYKTNSIQWASNDTAHTLPPSFYLTSAPPFFVSGSAQWPPVDPINGVVHNVPAQARWAACQPSPTAACVLGPQP